jgi:FkbM family methyltransferase
MPRIFDRLTRARRLLGRSASGFVNGLRFRFLFLRARRFSIPRRVYAAGKRVELKYPLDQGAQGDFFACFVANNYGLRQRMPRIRTILDIGANVGFFSIAARGRYPHATIHAYEPNPRVIPFLESNTALLGIATFPEAVGSHNGFVSMIDSGASNQARTSETSQSSSAEGGSIPQVSLLTAIERMGGSVDLLKLDCEGAEWEMFELTEAWKHIANVRMEYHLFRGETIAQVEESLRGLGFEPIHWEHDAGFGIVWARRPV